MNPRGSRPLERSGVRHALIRELAGGEVTQTELAAKYGVTTAAMTYFKQRHADRIAEVRQNLDNEFAGLWAARKAARIDALQRDIEIADGLLDPGSPGDDGVLSEGPDPAWARVKAQALRMIAEELGQIPNKPGAATPSDVTFTLKIPRPDTGDAIEVSMSTEATAETTTETTMDIEETSP